MLSKKIFLWAEWGVYVSVSCACLDTGVTEEVAFKVNAGGQPPKLVGMANGLRVTGRSGLDMLCGLLKPC